MALLEARPGLARPVGWGADPCGMPLNIVITWGNVVCGMSIGDILGPSFAAEEMADVIEEIINTYLDLRQAGETFLATYRRVGIEVFKERVYAEAH